MRRLVSFMGSDLLQVRFRRERPIRVRLAELALFRVSSGLEFPIYRWLTLPSV